MKPYVLEALKICPYCHFDPLPKGKMIWNTLMGGHACWDMECPRCGSAWVSDDKIHIKWQLKCQPVKVDLIPCATKICPWCYFDEPIRNANLEYAAYTSWDMKCPRCGKMWVSDDRIQPKWQKPPVDAVQP